MTHAKQWIRPSLQENRAFFVCLGKEVKRMIIQGFEKGFENCCSFSNKAFRQQAITGLPRDSRGDVETASVSRVFPAIPAASSRVILRKGFF